MIRDRYGRPGKGNDKGAVEGLVGLGAAQLHATPAEVDRPAGAMLLVGVIGRFVRRFTVTE